MTKILFVCHGNICRSPMAEFVMKDLVQKAEAGITVPYRLGRYQPARRSAIPSIRPRGASWPSTAIPCERPRRTPAHAAGLRRDYDLLIGMDQANLRNMRRICGGDPEGKIHLLLDLHRAAPASVADPWYTGDFETTWRDVDWWAAARLLGRIQTKEQNP